MSVSWESQAGQLVGEFSFHCPEKFQEVQLMSTDWTLPTQTHQGITCNALADSVYQGGTPLCA